MTAQACFRGRFGAVRLSRRQSSGSTTLTGRRFAIALGAAGFALAPPPAYAGASSGSSMLTTASNAVPVAAKRNLGAFPGTGTNPVIDNAADPTGASDNATIFQNIDTGFGVGGGIAVLPPGNYEINSLVTEGPASLWMTEPGAYFSGSSGLNGNVDSTVNNAAGKTRFGLYSNLQSVGTAANGSANEFEFVTMTRMNPATESLAPYIKASIFADVVGYDFSDYAAWSGGHANVTNFRDEVGGNFTTATAAGVPLQRLWGIHTEAGVLATSASTGQALEAEANQAATVNFTGSISGTTLTVTAIPNGALGVGNVISGAGVSGGTTITALGTATGQTGTYTVNNSQTVSSEAMTSPEIFENQNDSLNNIGCTSSGAVADVACLYMLGGGHFQDGVIADQAAINGNFLALYGNPGTTQSTYFSVDHQGRIVAGGTLFSPATETLGTDYTFRATGGDSFKSFVLTKGGIANPQQLQFGLSQASLFSSIQAVESAVVNNTLKINPQGGDVVHGVNNLATNATTGFLGIPSSAGAPTGTPANAAIASLCEVDSTNGGLACYYGSAWHHLAFVAGASGAPAHTQSSVASPTGTTSTTGVMMGLAGTVTPAYSGTVHVSVCGDITNSTSGDGANVQLRTGTGSAPANAAVLTGTTRGSLVKFVAASATNKTPFCVQWTVTGLTLGTAVWIDVGVAAVTGGTATIADVDILADEER